MSISCIIPTHARDSFLREAIISVVRQSHMPDEIIVVDDMDSPNTRLVVESLSEKHGYPIHYLTNLNGSHKGASSSRNAGAAVAKCDLLAFLDDDDLWTPRYLELMADKLSTSGLDWAVCWSSFISEDQLYAGHSMPETADTQQVFATNPGMTGSNFIVSRVLFDSVGGFDQRLRVSNDRDILIRLLITGVRYAVVTERLCLQRVHKSGQLTNRNEPRALGLEDFGNKYQDMMGLRAKRFLRREIYSVRRFSSESRIRRICYTVGQLLTYRPSELIDKLRHRQHPRLY